MTSFNRNPGIFNRELQNRDMLMCRICLNFKPRAENVPVSFVVQPFKDITGQDLKYDVELPHTLCTNCCTELNNFCAYRKMIIDKQNQLLMNLNNSRKARNMNSFHPYQINAPPHMLPPRIPSLVPQQQGPAPPPLAIPLSSFPRPNSSATPPRQPVPRLLFRAQLPANSQMFGRMKVKPPKPLKPLKPPKPVKLPKPVKQKPTKAPIAAREEQPVISPEVTLFPIPANQQNKQQQRLLHHDGEMKTSYITTNSGVETYEIIELSNDEDFNEPSVEPPKPPATVVNSIGIDDSDMVHLNGEIHTEDLLMDLFRSTPSPVIQPEPEPVEEKVERKYQVPKNFVKKSIMKKIKKEPKSGNRSHSRKKKIYTPKEGFHKKCLICGVCRWDRNYYSTPSEDTQFEFWMELLTLQDLNIPRDSVVCEKHFVDFSFAYCVQTMRKRLKRKAVPMVTDDEIVICRMRHEALSLGMVEDVSVALDIMNVEPAEPEETKITFQMKCEN